MNKLIFKSVVIAAFFIAANFNQALANDIKSSYIFKLDEPKKIELKLDKMFADKVLCEIFDRQGKKIFEEQIDTRRYKSKTYNLSTLPYGEYEIVIHDLMKIERLSFTIKTDTVDFSNNESRITYKPTVWVNSDKTVDFNLLTLGSSVEIKIYDGTREIYFGKTIGESSVSTRFNLGQLASGSYTMEIKSKGEIFYKYIHI